MKRKISTQVKKLPEWFDLKKYRGARKLDAIGWYTQLLVRFDILNNLQFIEPVDLMGNQDKESFYERLKSIRENPIVKSITLSDLLCLDNGPEDNTHVMVIDLDFPDDFLRHYFKQYLYRLRKEKAGAPKVGYGPSDFGKWVQYGVLPYIDLGIWQKEQNIKIPNRIIAAGIFDLRHHGEEAVRRTTKEYADFVMKPETMKTLKVQALSKKMAKIEF